MTDNILDAISIINKFQRLNTQNMVKDLELFRKHFVILFNSTEALIMRLNSLINILDFMPKNLRTVTMGVVGLGAALYQTINYSEEGEQLAGLSKQARLTTDKFQSLSNAVKKYGGTTEGVAQSMSVLGDNLADLKQGGDGNGLKETLDSSNINPAGIKLSEQFLNVISAKMGSMQTEIEHAITIFQNKSLRYCFEI